METHIEHRVTSGLHNCGAPNWLNAANALVLNVHNARIATHRAAILSQYYFLNLLFTPLQHLRVPHN